MGKCANSDAARVESGGAGMLSKKLVSAPRTPDLLREAEFAMLWPSNLRWKNEHDDDNKTILEPPCGGSQSAGNHIKSLRPATRTGVVHLVLLATQTQTLQTHSSIWRTAVPVAPLGVLLGCRAISNRPGPMDDPSPPQRHRPGVDIWPGTPTLRLATAWISPKGYGLD